jgi:hypothetical protein
VELVRDLGDCRRDNGLVKSGSIFIYLIQPKGEQVSHHIQTGKENTENKSDDDEYQVGALGILTRILCPRLDDFGFVVFGGGAVA